MIRTAPENVPIMMVMIAQLAQCGLGREHIAKILLRGGGRMQLGWFVCVRRVGRELN
jgi:hypothetical protein